MKTYIIDGSGKTIATVEGAVKIQVTELARLSEMDEATDPHVTFTLTEEGVITDCFDSGDIVGTAAQMWDDLWMVSP